MKAQKAISLAANRKAAGKTMEIIVDRVSPDGTGTGRSLLDIPEIDNTVVLNGLSPRIRPGDRIRCLVGLSGAYDLTAEPVRTVNKSKTKEKIKP